MPWRQKTGLQKNYTKTSCWLGALFGILFYAKEITGYTGSTRCKSVWSPLMLQYSVQLLPAMFLLVSFSYLFALSCFHLSGVKDCPHQKTAKKRRKYPKSILNPQTAKPPNHHIMCLKQTSPLYMNIITETSRSEIRKTQYDKGANDWDKDDMKDEWEVLRKEKERRRRCTTCMYSESQLELNWHLCARQCSAFNCTVLHCTPLSYTVIRTWYTHDITPHLISRREQVSFLCMCMFLCGVFVYRSCSVLQGCVTNLCILSKLSLSI